MTPLVVEATFEDGVLKPAAPLPLKQHDKVRLTVEALPAATMSPPLNLAKLFDDIEAEVGLFDGPPDLAAESDHYLYGAPKTHSSDGR
jgi:predicted DNA-binding antitoxin AbrB/MazE fold protein